MTVNPNDPAMPFVNKTTHTVESYKGLPIKLELAARFMSAIIASGNAGNSWEED